MHTQRHIDRRTFGISVAIHGTSVRRKSFGQAACSILPPGAGRAVFRRKPRSAEDIVAEQKHTHVFRTQYVTEIPVSDDRTLLLTNPSLANSRLSLIHISEPTR